MNNLRIFLWRKVFQELSYGMAVVIAHDSEEARQLLIKEMGYIHPDLALSPEVYDLDTCEPMAVYVYGGS